MRPFKAVGLVHITSQLCCKDDHFEDVNVQCSVSAFLFREQPSLFAPRRGSLAKPPDLDPFFDDLTRAKSAKELKEHLETRVL